MVRIPAKSVSVIRMRCPFLTSSNSQPCEQHFGWLLIVVLRREDFLGGKKSGGLPEYGKARNNNLKRQYSLTSVKAVLTFAYDFVDGAWDISCGYIPRNLCSILFISCQQTRAETSLFSAHFQFQPCSQVEREHSRYAIIHILQGKS